MINGLTTLLAAEATSAVRQHIRAAVWMAVSGVFCAGALGAGSIALHQWLSTFMPSLEATLWITGGFLVLALACFAISVVVKSARRDRSALGLTALALAPTAAQLVWRRMHLSTVAIGGIVVLGAMLGRKLGR